MVFSIILIACAILLLAGLALATTHRLSPPPPAKPLPVENLPPSLSVNTPPVIKIVPMGPKKMYVEYPDLRQMLKAHRSDPENNPEPLYTEEMVLSVTFPGPDGRPYTTLIREPTLHDYLAANCPAYLAEEVVVEWYQ